MSHSQLHTSVPQLHAQLHPVQHPQGPKVTQSSFHAMDVPDGQLPLEAQHIERLV
jgi:hypothetical protein